jgi:hypothetical protein
MESIAAPRTRREQYHAILDFEKEDPATNAGELEDVTELVFKAVDHLKDCEFLAKPDFDLNETMSAYEAMDAKMDIRLARS